MKKKKKSGKKKAAFDLEAFEKELNESKKGSEDGKKSKGDDDDEEDGPLDTSHLDQLDETELGENPFSRPDAPVGVDAGTEPWLTSDRDYTYPEVDSPLLYLIISNNHHLSSSRDSTPPFMLPILPSSPPLQNVTQLHLPLSTKKETKRPFSPTSPISAKRCIDR